MPNVSSPLGTTQPYIPLLHPTQLGRAAGLIMCFPTIEALTAAVLVERANVAAGNAIWAQGQPIVLVDEFFEGGVFRAWNGDDARTVFLRSGFPVALPADTSILRSGVGAPDNGAGVEGDVYVDWSSNLYYFKGPTDWAEAGPIYPDNSGGGGGGGGTGIPIPANNDGNNVEIQVPEFSGGDIFLRASTTVDGNLEVTGNAFVNRLALSASGAIETRSGNRLSIISDARLQLYSGGGPDAPNNGGDVRIFAKDHDTGFGGDVRIFAGTGTDGHGQVLLESQRQISILAPYIYAFGGMEVIGTGNGATIQERSFSFDGGAINAGTGESGGFVYMAGGWSSVGDGGTLTFVGGYSQGPVGSRGGSLYLTGGIGVAPDGGGPVPMGGDILLTSGVNEYTPTGAAPARVEVQAPTVDRGGSVVIQAGQAANPASPWSSVGGRIQLIAGQPYVIGPSSTPGRIDLEATQGGSLNITAAVLSLTNDTANLGSPTFSGTVTHPTAGAGPGANITIRRWIPVTLNSVNGWIPFYGA